MEVDSEQGIDPKAGSGDITPTSTFRYRANHEPPTMTPGTGKKANEDKMENNHPEQRTGDSQKKGNGKTFPPVAPWDFKIEKCNLVSY